MNQFEDKEINLCHGDKITCARHGKVAYTFRHSPVPRLWGCRYFDCCCPHIYRKGDEGRVNRTYGNGRRFRFIQRIKQDEAAELDGFVIRKRYKARSNAMYRMMYWGEYPERHVEKNWKSHRKTQYK